MARLNWMQRLYWRYLSKPATERDLFQFLLENPVSSVLEIGMGDGARTKRILKLIQVAEGTKQLRYVGVDLFESANDGTKHLTLKEAHKLLAEHGVKANLMPGDLGMALARVAHTVGGSDLVIVDAGLDPQRLSEGLIYPWLNRIATSSASIFCRPAASDKFQGVKAPSTVATSTKKAA